MTRVLYQFPISHYCEKARWLLDIKGVPYRVRNLAPGPHRKRSRRLGGAGTVPVLIVDGRGIGDSAAIFRHLEAEHPDPPLLPADPARRLQTEDLECHLHSEAGPAVRTWMWGVMLETAPGAAAAAFFHGYPLPARMLGRLISGKFESGLRRIYRITGEKIAAARATMDASVALIEREIGGDPRRYLVGDQLSIADITGASLLAPLVAPPGSPWDLPGAAPPVVQAAREALRARPAGQWVLERYRVDRPPSAARA